MAKAELSARTVRAAAQARRIVRQRGLDYVKVGVFDMDGVLRGKYMDVEKFMAALDKGFGFCDVILGWDSNDQLYDNTTFTGWHTGYPDAEVRIVPETCRDLPHEFDGRSLFFLAAFAGAAEAVCPRGLLARVLARAKDHGLGEAAERLQRSKAARNLFGHAFVEHFAASRDWEERQSRRAVTDWQLQRYFEII